MSSNRDRRPAIFQIGQVRDDGKVVKVYGWGLGQCLARCSCHLDPVSSALTIAEESTRGLLGLISHRPCNCCGPWTAKELAGFVADLAAIDAIPTGGEPDRNPK